MGARGGEEVTSGHIKRRLVPGERAKKQRFHENKIVTEKNRKTNVCYWKCLRDLRASDAISATVKQFP